MNTFSIGGTIRFAWETFKKRPWIFVGTTVIIFVVNLLIEALVRGFEDGALEIVGIAISLAASTLIGLGMTAFYVKAHDAVEAADVKQLWHPHDFWKYLGTTILNGLAVLLVFVPFIIALVLTVGTGVLSANSADPAVVFGSMGAVALVLLVASVIAALYVSSMLLFGTYAVVDRAMGPIAALKESIKVTKGNRIKVIGFLLTLVLLNILGAIALFVGLLVTVPMTLLGLVHVYRTLSPRAPVTA